MPLISACCAEAAVAHAKAKTTAKSDSLDIVSLQAGDGLRMRAATCTSDDLLECFVILVMLLDSLNFFSVDFD